MGLLATLAGAGSTLLMLHFLQRLRLAAVAGDGTAPAGLVLPWLAMAFAAVAVPWMLFFSAGIGSLAEALAPAALWAALWPVLLGGALAALLRRWGDRLPQVPEGDIVVIAQRAARPAPAWGEPLARAESVLQRWPVSLSSALRALRRGGACRWRVPRSSCSAGPSPASPYSRSCWSWAQPSSARTYEASGSYGSTARS